MADKKDPQSFALVLADADGGLLNRQISEAWQDLSDDLDSRSFLHDQEMKGEITIKLKVSNDHGKVLLTPVTISTKKPATQYTKARFYRLEDGSLSTQDPRVRMDLFAAKRAADGQQGKSAAAPKVAGAKE